MNKISTNVQVILAVNLPCRATMGPRELYDMAAEPSLIHLCASLLEEGSQGCKLPWAASTHKHALHLEKEKNWTRRRRSPVSIGLQTTHCDLCTTST